MLDGDSSILLDVMKVVLLLLLQFLFPTSHHICDVRWEIRYNNFYATFNKKCSFSTLTVNFTFTHPAH